MRPSFVHHYITIRTRRGNSPIGNWPDLNFTKRDGMPADENKSVTFFGGEINMEGTRYSLGDPFSSDDGQGHNKPNFSIMLIRMLTSKFP